MLQSFSQKSPLVLIGCGHMGHAMAVGWLRAGLNPAHLFIVDPVATPMMVPGACEAQFLADLVDLPADKNPKAIVVAVKPQIIGQVLAPLARIASDNTMVISIAAGITLDTLKGGVGAAATYVRAMPNMPAAIGEGITGLAGTRDISDENMALARELMRAMGETVWLDGEDMIDAVTAVSGSGPAYAFYLVECMAAAGVRVGLPEEVAMTLARQTVIGAGKLLDADTELAAADLRRRVTSPGGTTAAALDVLMDADTGLGALMENAIAAAYDRGRVLGGKA